MEVIVLLNEERLIDYLARYDKAFLYQKTGYLLEAFQQEFRLPESFFATCEARSSNSKGYFSKNDRKDYIMHKRWKLYAPADLTKIIDKGVDYLDAAI